MMLSVQRIEDGLREEHQHHQLEAGLVVGILVEDYKGETQSQSHRDTSTKMIGVEVGGASFDLCTALLLGYGKGGYFSMLPCDFLLRI